MMPANGGAVQFLYAHAIVLLVFMCFRGVGFESLCIGPKSNLHHNFKTNPKTDDVKTKKRL